MDFKTAKKLGACLARDYAEGMFRLLVNYRDISASEAASRLGLHIRTAQDFLETLTGLEILDREVASEGKRPYYRYRLVQPSITLELDMESLSAPSQATEERDRPIRERKGNGARFATARSGDQIASVSIWSGTGRERKERRLHLTAAQGRFLFHLPFPTAEAMTASHIMEKAGLEEDVRGEIIDLVCTLEELGVIES